MQMDEQLCVCVCVCGWGGGECVREWVVYRGWGPATGCIWSAEALSHTDPV